MNKLLFILGISLGSVVVGYLVRRLAPRLLRFDAEVLPGLSKNIKLIAMFVLNPIPILDSFWRLPLDFHGVVFLPLLGPLSLAVGAAGATVMNALFKIPPKRAASVFVSGMFTNIVTFGGLTAYVFFGYQGYGMVMLFNLFISFGYYAVGFPLSARIASGTARGFVLSPKPLLERPYLFIPLATIAAGLLLNATGVPRPHWLDSVASPLVAFLAGLLGFSIGLTLWFGRMSAYRREVALVAAIKFVLIPLVILPLGLLLGLQHVQGGLPFRVLCVVAFMPVAFNSLVPPALYGFDLDLANSAWIVTTLSLIVVLPILYLFLGIS